ncbi:MAG: ABC transporter substrate-binding protein [Pseudomonadota bacterium]
MSLRANLIGVVMAIAALSAQASDNAIVVGQAIDLSGPNGSIGRDYVAGITTYFDSVNVKGGVNGRKIRYVVRDDHGDAAESARLAGSLIKQDRATYMLGAIGAEATQAIIANPVFQQSRQVLFAPLADSSAVPSERALFWRPSVESEFDFILSYFQKLGVKKVAIAMQDSAQSARAYRFVSIELTKRGMTLVGVAKVSDSPAANAVAAQKLSATGARLVITMADTIGSAQFLKLFRKHDPATFFAGTSLINLETLSQIAGAGATEFTVFSQVVPNPGSNATVLQAEHINMMKKFRDEPASALTLEGFAVAKTLVRGMQTETAGRGGLQAMATSKVGFDLGGMTMLIDQKGNNLSRYVDIALFKRGGGLMF